MSEMTLYQIGTLTVAAKQLPKPYREFQIKGDLTKRDAANIVTIRRGGKPERKQTERPASESSLMRVFRSDGGGWYFEDIKERAVLSVSQDYHTGTYWVREGEPEEEVLRPLIQAMLECCLINSGTAILHAACVKKDGVGIAFSGESGAGKSTRALQWVEQLHAEWLSGDRPAVEAGTCKVYGVPWDGKEQIYRQLSCPLRCILEVRKASVTMLSRLPVRQACSFLAKQIMLPMWDTALTVKAFEELRQIAESVPVYRMYCDRTEEAAWEVYQSIFGEDTSKEIRTEKESADMKLKAGFEIAEIAGDYMAIPTGENIATYGGSVVLNEVSAFLLTNMNQGATREELLTLVLNEYEVDKQRAETDLDAILKTFAELGLTEE